MCAWCILCMGKVIYYLVPIKPSLSAMCLSVSYHVGDEIKSLKKLKSTQGIQNFYIQYSQHLMQCLTTQESKDKIKQKPAQKHPKHKIMKLKYCVYQNNKTRVYLVALISLDLLDSCMMFFPVSLISDNILLFLFTLLSILKVQLLRCQLYGVQYIFNFIHSIIYSQCLFLEGLFFFV